MRTVSALRMAAAALVVAVTALSSNVANANLIQNGDFSSGDFTDWTLFTTLGGSTSPDVTSFDVTGSGASLAAEFNVGSGGGGILQTVTTPAGVATFSASLATSCKTCFNVMNADGGLYAVLLDGVEMATYQVPQSQTVYVPSLGLIAAMSSLSFTADVSAGSHTIELLITRRFTSSSGTPHEYLDDISLNVAPTPLPGALPLFASGLGALGLLARRRKRKAATVRASV